MSLELWVTPDYWRQLLPNFHVQVVPLLAQTPIFNVETAAGPELDGLLLREGYFHTGPPNWALPVRDLAQAILTLQQHQWVPVFGFLYDEFWLLFHQLKNVMGRLLGPDFLLLPEFWAWCIDPQKEQAGWKPHRDKRGVGLRPDGRPKTLTVWVPLTDATHLNSCIYVVPADRDPFYNKSGEEKWSFELPDVRALPAAAGSILCWNSEVLHWGARSSPRATHPRISVAYEYQRADEKPFNQPLMPCGTFPDFDSRLLLVAKQLLQYQHMYPLTPELLALAQHVVARVK